jgi:hypothetical protein
LAEKKITFPSLKSDWPTAQKQFGLQWTPTNLVIDQKGQILFRKVGFNIKDGPAQLASLVEAVLARKSATAARSAVSPP